MIMTTLLKLKNG